MKKSFSKNKQNEEFVYKNWSYPLDKKWKRSRILSCHSRFLKRESHKQKSYKFHKKYSADIYTICLPDDEFHW